MNEPEKLYRDNLEVVQHLSKVHSTNILPYINSDILLASLDKEKDREFIINMSYNAQAIFDIQMQRLRFKHQIFIPNGHPLPDLPNLTEHQTLSTGKWYKYDQSKAEQERIIQQAHRLARMVFHKPLVLSIVNRNRKDNPLTYNLLRRSIEVEENLNNNQEMKFNEKIGQLLKQNNDRRE